MSVTAVRQLAQQQQLIIRMEDDRMGLSVARQNPATIYGLDLAQQVSMISNNNNVVGGGGGASQIY